jgi:type III secretory pathway component EscV
MLEVFAVAAAIALIFAIVTGLVALTFTVICIIAGVGLGAILTWSILSKQAEKKQHQEEMRRERDHQRMLELIHAGRSVNRDWPTTIEQLPRRSTQRIGRQ